nr:putative short-chain dehydrogenase/reductase [Cladonia uncialis subsp. uncialis]
MSSLWIEEAEVPSLVGKVAIVTGGASGIGFATAQILARHGAKVFILDLNKPEEEPDSSLITYKKCNVTNWSELYSIFMSIDHIDMVFANAGISENEPFLQDDFAVDVEGCPLEPTYPVLDVNLRSVLNVIKLSWRIMKDQSEGGSIVLTSSSTAYSPEIGIPLYSALKSALIGLVRSLRSTLPTTNITINAVAPSATYTPLIREFVKPIDAAGLPVSTPEFVGLALVYSATARQSRGVEAYGKEKEADILHEGRWNGRVIMTLGTRYTELEEPIAELRPVWFGKENFELSRAQQAATDPRGSDHI